MIRVAAFDAYGTLLDFNAAAAACSDALGDGTTAISELWRRKQLEYTWLRSLMGRHADFRRVTADALDFALEAHGTADTAVRARLLDLYGALAPHAGARESLDAARDLGLGTCVLSNGTPDMLEAGLGSAGLTVDAILSIEAVGIYKPDPRVYALVCDRFDVIPPEVAFVTANGWDAAGAAAFGFKVVWINRAGAPVDRLPAGPAAVLRDLGDLAAQLRRWATADA